MSPDSSTFDRAKSLAVLISSDQSNIVPHLATNVRNLDEAMVDYLWGEDETASIKPTRLELPRFSTRFSPHLRTQNRSLTSYGCR